MAKKKKVAERKMLFKKEVAVKGLKSTDVSKM